MVGLVNIKINKIHHTGPSPQSREATRKQRIIIQRDIRHLCKES